uniref:Mannosyltransferase n=1 Tax=Romanomermis culicivorax TaxID=13658 RepID=A0A915L8Q0_ROMCU
ISSAALPLKIILNALSLFLTSYSIHYQYFPLFPAAFGVNVALGWTTFVAHGVTNHKALALACLALRLGLDLNPIKE